MFLKISQFLQENTCVGVSFNKIAGPQDTSKTPLVAALGRWFFSLCQYLPGLENIDIKENNGANLLK